MFHFDNDGKTQRKYRKNEENRPSSGSIDYNFDELSSDEFFKNHKNKSKKTHNYLREEIENMNIEYFFSLGQERLQKNQIEMAIDTFYNCKNN